MADATLTDVVKKLEEVKSAVTAGDKVTAGASAKSEEAGAEGARKDAELKKIFEAIRDKLGMKSKGKDDIDDIDGSGFRDNILASLAGALSGAIAGIGVGLTLGFIDFYKSIFKLAGKGFAKMFPNITKTLSGIFGKGGKISKFFMSIKAFFTESKAFKTISEGFTKFKTMMSNFGKTVMKSVDPILDSFKSLQKLFGAGGKAPMTALKSFGKFFGKFFGAFKGFFSKLFLPLQVIMSLFDGFFEAKDAAGKSEGMLATFFNSIVGFFGGILDGLIFGMLDLIKDGIAWVAGFLGFEDVEASLNSFSFSAMFNEFLDDVYKWFNLLFSDPVAALTALVSNYFGAALSVGDFIVDMIKKPIAWLLGLFGWDEAADQVSTFSFKDTVMNVFNSAVTWIKGLFADPVAGLTKLLGTIASGYLTFLDFITAPLKKGIAWVLRLFGWDEAAEATETFSFTDTIMGVFESAKKWIMGLFSWSQEPVKEDDSFIVKTIKGVVKTVKDWFGNMFKFDSGSDVLKSVLNIMMWIPNLLVKAMLGVTSFVAGLLGFDEKSEDLATAGKDFSFGDLIGDGLTALADWLKGLFDIDVDAIGKSLLGDTVYNALFGTAEGVTRKDVGTVKQAEEKFKEGRSDKSRKELVSAGLLDEDYGSKDNLDIEKIKAALEKTQNDKSKQSALVSALTLQLGDTKIAESERQQLAGLLELTKNLKFKGSAEGGLVGMSPFATGSLGKAFGLESGGLFTLSQGEMVLDNQAAATFLKAAQMLTGSQMLEQSRMGGGGGQPVIINNNNVDNSVKSNSRQNISVPESTRTNESTLRALQMAG